MKKIVTLIFCVMFVACQQQAKYPKGIEHVIVIGLDGLSSTGFQASVTPFMDSMLHHGAYSYTVRCILPTVSTPNWNAMLCGAGPEITGAINNAWKANDFNFPYPVMSKDRSFPNIFRIIREQKPDAELGAIYHWGGFHDMLEDALLNKSETCPSQLETAQKSAEYILEKKPHFLFIQLDGIDGAGHEHGHMSPGYLKYIEETDTHVRLLIDAVQQAGIAGKTLVIVVGDHGGIFHGHGGNTYDELTTPIIFFGKGIKQDYPIQQQIYKYDLAADVAFALGLKAPQVWTGRPTKPAHTGFDEPDNLWKEWEVLPSPRFASETYKAPFGGDFVNRATVAILPPEGTEGVIRYTTDESVPTAESPIYNGPFTVETTTVVNAKMFSDKGESVKVMAIYKITDDKGEEK
ncbi:MAG: alkaline phosphatase family protein [Tannerella sp.]|nr:alkaline phosphatase family protein [Tannerella sp.]